MWKQIYTQSLLSVLKIVLKNTENRVGARIQLYFILFRVSSSVPSGFGTWSCALFSVPGRNCHSHWHQCRVEFFLLDLSTINSVCHGPLIAEYCMTDGMFPFKADRIGLPGVLDMQISFLVSSSGSHDCSCQTSHSWRL